MTNRLAKGNFPVWWLFSEQFLEDNLLINHQLNIYYRFWTQVNIVFTDKEKICCSEFHMCFLADKDRLFSTIMTENSSDSSVITGRFLIRSFHKSLMLTLFLQVWNSQGDRILKMIYTS